MIDLDRFKLVNDGHGHATGDELLKMMAAGLTAVAAESAADETTVVRQGGDEFLISLHAGHALDSKDLAEALDRLRLTTMTTSDGAEIPLAFSYGMSSDAGSPDLLSMIRSADLAAYEDKARRRSVEQLRPPAPADERGHAAA